MPLNWTTVSEVITRAEVGGVTIGVAALAPAGEPFAYHGSRRFVAASTVKIAIMVELFRRIDAGRITLEQRHILREDEKAGGSGVVSNLHTGIEMTIRDLVYLMMSVSDNSSTNILIDALGIEAINATMCDIGMQHSTLGRKMRGRHLVASEAENWAVPEDYVTVIKSILDGHAASSESCAQMVALLEKQQNDRRIARHLPQTNRPRWGTKTGSLPGVVNDVGFIMTGRGPLILAVFCEGLTDGPTGEQIVGDIAKAALDLVS
ncbi:serine hydrolase [Acidisphaera sp. L21]|uniref:serine hydrolase n=1 Tax=Acidisphaera sp. L21 TaxID=1641851 RepID=UPI00131C1357|nr:serine hydrolase [Acidisphaera sp. L21]